ncbi:MAG: transcription antitermination factor NusB [Patescibacteria group bacterium]
MNRHLSRVIIMQTLYEWDFRPKATIDEIKQRNIVNYQQKIDHAYIDQTIKGVIENQKEIDEKIQSAAPEWPLEQISAIDKTILRIAIFEIFESKDIPHKVAINEAVELGKTFGGQNSSKFINGVLGTIWRDYSNTDKKKSIKEENE